MRRAAIVLGLVLVTVVTTAHAAEPQASDVERFYFTGPHLFPFARGIAGLMARDMNGDGRTDLILLDPRASKFHILRQEAEGQRKPAQKASEWSESDANELEPDRLLAEDELRLNETVRGYEVGAFAGAPAAIVYMTGDKELVVERPAVDGEWEVAQRFLLDLDSAGVGGLERADLDGDGRDDLILLAQDSLLIFPQGPDGRLREARRYPIAIEKSAGLVVGDVNNDGRADLLYRSPGTRYPLRVRITQADGAPGPEYRFRMPMPRSVDVGDCTGDGNNEIVLIESSTNRVKALRWTLHEPGQGAGAEAGDLELLPFTRDEKSRNRVFAVADVDGNGLLDVIVSDPSAARLSLMLSREGVGLTPAESFPSLEEPSALVAVTPRLGPAEIVVCSRKEGMIGLSRYDAKTGRLSYPKPLRVPGEPYCAAVGTGPTGRGPYLYCAVQAEPKEGEEKGAVEIVTLERAGESYEVKRRQTLEGMKQPPAQLVTVDANGDGASDLLALAQYGPPALLIQGRDGTFQNVSDAPGFYKHMLRNQKPASVASAPLRADEPPALLLAGRNLVRAVRYDGTNLLVEDQFSSTNARSDYAALTAADLDGDGEAELLVVDNTSKWLAILKRNKKGVYEAARQVDIGPFAFLGLATADTDGDGRAEVLLVGQEKLGVLFLHEAAPELKEVAAFETDDEDTTYAQVQVVDLNADGKNELLLREVQKHQLEVLYRSADAEWKTGMRFKVFQGRIFERRDTPAPEPREVVAADLTGDGLTDLAIIVHDRVIVYPQQGTPERGAEN